MRLLSSEGRTTLGSGVPPTDGQDTRSLHHTHGKRVENRRRGRPPTGHRRRPHAAQTRERKRAGRRAHQPARQPAPAPSQPVLSRSVGACAPLVSQASSPPARRKSNQARVWLQKSKFQKKIPALYGDLNLDEIKNILRLLSVNGEMNIINLSML